MATPEWLEQGFSHIWLPYTQMKTTPLPLPVVGAKGSCLTLADGRKLVDGIASWWSVCHGYGREEIQQAMVEQISSLSHVMLGGLAHEQAYRLAKRLVDVTPAGLSHVFFSDSGSVAVEVAMKMAVQYWKQKGERNRTKFIALRYGYHGDTMGCMAVGDPEQSMHHLFSNYLSKHYVVDLPCDEYSFAEFDSLLSDISGNAAAMILEPLVQGAGGMRFYSADTLAEIYRICQKYNILLIADEVATGFGRTGHMFACEEAAIVPDILCLGKALTGGMVSLAATLAIDEVYEAFLSDNADTALMHGPTFMGNPLACAAANASLDIFEKEPVLRDVDRIEHYLHYALDHCRDMQYIRDVRVKGAVGALQFRHLGEKEKQWMRDYAIEQGVWLRPLEDVLYVMPPFVISEEELEKVTNVMVNIAKQYGSIVSVCP